MCVREDVRAKSMDLVLFILNNRRQNALRVTMPGCPTREELHHRAPVRSVDEAEHRASLCARLFDHNFERNVQIEINACIALHTRVEVLKTLKMCLIRDEKKTASEKQTCLELSLNLGMWSNLVSSGFELLYTKEYTWVCCHWQFLVQILAKMFRSFLCMQVNRDKKIALDSKKTEWMKKENWIWGVKRQQSISCHAKDDQRTVSGQRSHESSAQNLQPRTFSPESSSQSLQHNNEVKRACKTFAQSFPSVSVLMCISQDKKSTTRDKEAKRTFESLGQGKKGQQNGNNRRECEEVMTKRGCIFERKSDDVLPKEEKVHLRLQFNV